MPGLFIDVKLDARAAADARRREAETHPFCQRDVSLATFVQNAINEEVEASSIVQPMVSHGKRQDAAAMRPSEFSPLQWVCHIEPFRRIGNAP